MVWKLRNVRAFLSAPLFGALLVIVCISSPIAKSPFDISVRNVAEAESRGFGDAHGGGGGGGACDVAKSELPPLISVCMPVYNGAEVIGGNFKAILDQTYKNMEVLVSVEPTDDAKETIEVVDRLRKAYPKANVKVYQHPERLGWIRNVNFLLLEAAGDFVSIMAHDDRVLPEYYEKLGSCLQANPRVVNCYPYISRMRRFNTSNTRRQFSQPSIRGTVDDRVLDVVKLTHNWVSYRGLVRRQAPFHGMHSFLLMPCGETGSCTLADHTLGVQHAVFGEMIEVDVPYFKTWRQTSTSRILVSNLTKKQKAQTWIDSMANAYLAASMYVSDEGLLYRKVTEALADKVPSGWQSSSLVDFRQKVLGPRRVAVLGGGIQGCVMALLLRKHGFAVSLFDKSEDVLTGASNNQEGKIHMGFVYSADKTMKTGERIMEAALRFAGELEKLLGEKIDWGQWKSTKFDYLVPHDSLLSPEQLEAYFSKLQDVYRGFLEADPSLSYLGTRPHSIYRRIPLPAHVNTSFFAAAFETEEYAISHRQFRDTVKRVLLEKGITVVLGTRVLEVNRSPLSKREPVTRKFVVVTDKGDRNVDLVVNCLWEGRRPIDRSLGWPQWSGDNLRLKFGIRTRYIEELSQIPSYTIVNGPFGDFVRYESDRQMYFTWYPVSVAEHGVVSSEEVPREWENISNGIIPPSLWDHQVESHLRAWKELFPHANFRFNCPRLIGGFILANGKTDIHDAESGIHKRSDDPIRHEDGYFSISTQKFTSAPYHAFLFNKTYLPLLFLEPETDDEHDDDDGP